MEQQFFEDEFEQFLKENTDQHRMYPSDGVWTNIYRHLHSGRRRIAIGVLFLLIMSGVLWLTTNQPGVTPQGMLAPAISQKAPVSSELTAKVSVNDIIAKLRAKSLMPPLSFDAPTKLTPLRLKNAFHLKDASSFALVPADQSQVTIQSAQNASKELEVSLAKNFKVSGSRAMPLVDEQIAGEKTVITGNSIAADELATDEIALYRLPAFNLPEPGFLEIPETILNFPEPKQPSQKISNQAVNSSLVQLSQVRSNRNRLSFVMSFAPSIGYRNLSAGRNQSIAGTSPLMVRHLDVNQFVDHQPAVGFELGGNIRYPVSRSLTFKTGLQLNLTRYSIAAFAHTPEKTTVTLNSPYGYQRQSLVATSNLRNIEGNTPERLTNQYLQLALPVGAEMKLFGDSRFQVSLAGSLQPVYLLNTNQYLLSSNFSNYVREPSLMRRWNLATSMEAFVSYSAEKLRWQVGPQFRYNLMSTYNSQYPIHENLMEYGVKIGVSKTIR